VVDFITLADGSGIEDAAVEKQQLKNAKMLTGAKVQRMLSFWRRPDFTRPA